MKETQEVVRTAGGDEWPFNTVLPESIEEAVEVYGEDGAIYLLNSGLKVKEQNVARELFRNGKDTDEVNEAVAAYRPGSGGRTSIKKQALELIVKNTETLRENPDLMTQIQEAFLGSKFKDVIELLG